MGSNFLNFNAPGIYPLELENEMDHDISESWKSTLNFTGSNPVFPVEMFIALMEHKYTIHSNNGNNSKEQQSSLCTNILNHICGDEMSPASLWKKQFLSDIQLGNITWSAMKKDLTKHFGQQNTLPGSCYSMQERLLLFYSLMKNPDESISYFRVRVNIVASILEHGKLTKQANQDWVRLFFLLGLNEEERSLIIEEADYIYDLSGLCSLLLERKQALTSSGDVEETKETIDSQIVSENAISTVIPEENSSPMKVNVLSNSGEMNDIQAFDPHEVMNEDSKHKKSGIKQEIQETNPTLVVEWENEAHFPSMQQNLSSKLRVKKRKKGIKMRQNLRKSHDSSPSVNKVVNSARSVCVICNKNFDSVGEFKKHNLEAHPADKPTKVIIYFLQISKPLGSFYKHKIWMLMTQNTSLLFVRNIYFIPDNIVSTL
jgi:hypothetical protein